MWSHTDSIFFIQHITIMSVPNTTLSHTTERRKRTFALSFISLSLSTFWFRCLPLRLLLLLESLDDGDDALEGGEPLLELLLDFGLVVAQLGVKVLAVRGGAHGGAEDGLDDERVVRLERVAVGRAERVRQLLARVLDVLAQRLRGEVEAAGG